MICQDMRVRESHYAGRMIIIFHYFFQSTQIRVIKNILCLSRSVMLHAQVKGYIYIYWVLRALYQYTPSWKYIGTTVRSCLVYYSETTYNGLSCIITRSKWTLTDARLIPIALVLPGFTRYGHL